MTFAPTVRGFCAQRLRPRCWTIEETLVAVDPFVALLLRSRLEATRKDRDGDPDAM